MKLVSEKSEFGTVRSIYFRGKEYEAGDGLVTLTIKVQGITTEQMTARLEHLATETAEKIKEIVAAQEAPQQFIDEVFSVKPEDEELNLWLQLGKENQQATGDTASEC